MRKLHFVEKFSFKEKRFLYDGKGPEGGPVVPAKPEEGAKADKAAEIVDRKKGDMVALQTELAAGLEKSGDKGLLQKYLSEVKKIAGFEAKKTVDVLNPDFSLLANGNDKALYALIYAAYGKASADFSSFAKIVGIDTEDPKTLEKNFMAIVSISLANSFVKKAKADFASKYKNLNKFLETESGKPFKDGKIDVTFKYDDAKGMLVEFVPAAGLDDAYAAFAKTQPAEPEKPAEAKSLELKSVDDKVAYISASPIGKILKLFGYGKDGNAGFKKIFEGGDPFVGGLLVFLGFGEKLGLGSFDELVGSLPDVGGLKANLVKMHEQAKKNPKFGVAGVDESKLKLGEVKAPDYEAFDEAKFLDKKVKKGEAIDPAKDGIRVDKELKLGEGDKPKNLKVDLSAGGEIVVDGGAAGVKLVVNGKDVPVESGKFVRLGKDTADAEIKSKNGIAVLTGVIPAGVVFTKTCKLSEEKVVVAEAVAAMPAK